MPRREVQAERACRSQGVLRRDVLCDRGPTGRDASWQQRSFCCSPYSAQRKRSELRHPFADAASATCVKSTFTISRKASRMNKVLGAIALTIALPTVAHAQAPSASAAEKGCCAKMKAEGKECACCKGMDHSKMDHSSMGEAAKPADPHAGHSGPVAGHRAPPPDHTTSR